MMAGAEEPATLSGFCQPMAMAMVSVLRTSIQDQKRRRAEGSESARFWWRFEVKGLRSTGDIGRFRVGNMDGFGGGRWPVV